VNDLGGVNVCLPEAVNDPASGLDLSAGTHHVNGAQALAFVRERHIGEGSDLQRIQRQQFFMAALLQQIGDQKTLSDVPRLYTIARDVARTLTTDSGLSVGTMLSVADGMKGSTSKGVQFTQVPVIADPNDANRVRWQQPQAAQLFSAVARDQSVAKPAKTSGATPKASASRSATSADSPAQVAVKVLRQAWRRRRPPRSARATTTSSARGTPSHRPRARSSSTARRRAPRRPRPSRRSSRTLKSSR